MSDSHLEAMQCASRNALIGARAEIANILIALRHEDHPDVPSAVAAAMRLDNALGNAEVALCVRPEKGENA